VLGFLRSLFIFRRLDSDLLSLSFSILSFVFRGLGSARFRGCFTLSQSVQFFFRALSVLFK
jgi:hypothetical protein